MKKPNKAFYKCSLKVNGKLVLKNTPFAQIISYLQNQNLITLEEQYYRVIDNDWRDDDYKPKYNMIYADFKKLVGKEIELITL